VSALDFAVRGLIAGLVIAVPVGPVNVFCVRHMLAKGWRSGVLSGLGAAAGDTLYGAIAAFSIRFIIQFLHVQQSRIRLAGGILLTIIGALHFRRRSSPFSGPQRGPAQYSDLISSFLLNLTNPTAVLSFLGVLAALGLAYGRHWSSTVFLVSGIFCGSMTWWIVLSAAVHHLRHRFTPRMVIAMNRVAGLAIGGFGVALIALSCM